MTLILGIGYPLIVTSFGQFAFSDKANGQLLRKSDVIVGSRLIGQKFESSKYFWGRPSAIDYVPVPSGGSNLGPTSDQLKKIYEERKLKLTLAHPENKTDPPQDLLFASASGLDPHISVKAAQYQLQRVAQARGMELEKVKKVVNSLIEDRQYHVLGEPRVNVLELNRALDNVQGNDLSER